jgi:hypothetical protein
VRHRGGALNNNTLGAARVIQADFQFSFSARDPGVRGGEAGAGGPIAGLTAREFEFFQTGKEDFEEVEVVADGPTSRWSWPSRRSRRWR